MIDTPRTLLLLLCGIIDKRYDEALYGTYHASEDGFRTLCGQRCGGERETRSTLWRNKGRIRHADNEVSCNRCRRCLGLSKISQSRVSL